MVKSSLRKITESVAKKQKLPVEDIEKFVTAFFEVTDEGLHADKQVKIKGLGTFKITTVKPRESVNVNTGERVLISSHDKVTFTPDATMKELVNKPFAQFKTVVVNDGVDVAKLETTEQLEEERDKASTSEEQKVEEEPQTVESEEFQSAKDNEKEPVAEIEEIEAPHEIENTVSVEIKEEPNEEKIEQEATFTPREVKIEPIVQEEHAQAQPEAPIQAVESAPLKRQKRHYWLAISLIVAFILGVAILSYNSFQTAPKQPSVVTKAQTKAQAQTRQPNAKASQSKRVAEDPYAIKPMAEYMKDPRIKYGAYDIVGIDRIVTLREGQTLQSICNSTLGSYMICYFEAVNPNKDLKAGDKVRIPKVKIRKRN